LCWILYHNLILAFLGGSFLHMGSRFLILRVQVLSIRLSLSFRVNFSLFFNLIVPIVKKKIIVIIELKKLKVTILKKLESYCFIRISVFTNQLEFVSVLPELVCLHTNFNFLFVIDFGYLKKIMNQYLLKLVCIVNQFHLFVIVIFMLV
jgi:hypothetical protein